MLNMQGGGTPGPGLRTTDRVNQCYDPAQLKDTDEQTKEFFFF